MGRVLEDWIASEVDCTDIQYDVFQLRGVGTAKADVEFVVFFGDDRMNVSSLDGGRL
jgi:hypothetical protein